MSQVTPDGESDSSSGGATGRANRHSFWRRIVVPTVCGALLIAWTAALLTPIPAAAVRALGGPAPSFWFAKTLHVSVYAMLAILAVLLPLSRNWRLVALALLAVHGCATEYLQQFVERTSSFRDVGLDCLGIILGTCLALGGRRWYRRKFRGEDSQANLQHDSRGKNADAADLR
jgi:VanZ family protein